MNNLIAIRHNVEKYRSLKAQIEALEAELSPVKSDLEAVALEAGGKFVAEFGTIQLVEASRESISVSEAKAKLGDAATPLIKKSFFTMLKVK